MQSFTPIVETDDSGLRDVQRLTMTELREITEHPLITEHGTSCKLYAEYRSEVRKSGEQHKIQYWLTFTTGSCRMVFRAGEEPLQYLADNGVHVYSETVGGGMMFAFNVDDGEPHSLYKHPLADVGQHLWPRYFFRVAQTIAKLEAFKPRGDSK